MEVADFSIIEKVFDPLGDQLSSIALLHTSPFMSQMFYGTDDCDNENNALSSLDIAIVKAARASLGQGTKTKEEDVKRIKSIVNRGHTSCLEMVEYTFFVKCPIFVARQWQRHRTWSYNELSRRYTEENIEFYLPEIWRKQDGYEKQGGEEVFDTGNAKIFSRFLETTSNDALYKYETMIANGVSREMARMILPVNLYTQFYAKTDLNNLLKFISLRADKHAQWEIRRYAEVILDCILPVTNPIVREAYLTRK